MKIAAPYFFIFICIIFTFTCCGSKDSKVVQKDGKTLPYDSLAFHYEKLGEVGNSHVYKITYEDRSYIMLDPDHGGYTATLIKQ